MLNIFFRSLILYGIVVLVVRVMGKRQIGQLQPFELVIAIMLADLASAPVDDVGVPLIKGVVPIFALAFAQIIISFLSLKSERFRTLIGGSPSILIENGVLQQKKLEQLRINLNDLLEQLRSQNIANIDDVEFAILETNGNLSVFPKVDKKAPTLEDLNIQGKPESIPVTLIMDGQIMYKNLKKAGQDLNWLLGQIKNLGLDRKSVFFAYLDTQNQLKVIAKQKERAQ
ncbi:MAG: DUF421 domain-containing protein [Caldicoprobacterales bacterium]|nr:DUF421 domain-containing protein [Clostridiales bacterium]